MNQYKIFALSLFLCSAACTKADDSGLPGPVQNPQLAGGGTEPVSNWKSERKRIAMLGLNYESGKVLRVESEASQVLAELSKADLSRLSREGSRQYERHH